jgi:hypothetical protein
MRAVPATVAAGGEIEAVLSCGPIRGPDFGLEQATEEPWAWWFPAAATDAGDLVSTTTGEEFVARDVV